MLYYLHTDHLGSASLTTDASGNIHAQQRYFPYGETRWSSAPLPTDRQFTGQRREAALGIYDYKARFYSPRLGRFLSADTLVPGVGSRHLNRYMYVEGNPVRYNDPTGHARPTEESENYNYTGTGPYPGFPGWYEAGRAYQSYLEARYKYANRPDIVAGRKETFEMYRSRARMAMPQVLWTEDNVASLYDTAGMTGIGLAASLSGGPDNLGVGTPPDSLRLHERLDYMETRWDTTARESWEQVEPDEILKRAVRGPQDYRLRSGEQGLSVYVRVSDERIKDAGLQGDVKHTSARTVKDMGLTIQKTPGEIPTISIYHFEIRPGSEMTRRTFKQMLNQIPWE